MKKAQITSDIPLDGIAFQVGYTETGSHEIASESASFWYGFQP